MAHCSDAPSGWNFLRQRLPDLVLLDHNLPGISGLELCRAIRATPSLSALRLGLFGHGQLNHDLLTGLQSGIDFFVGKELLTEPEAWQQRLKEILGWTYGQRWQSLVSWLEEATLPELPATWVDVLNQALRHASLQQLRPQILRLLLLRSLRQVISSSSTDTELESWLAGDSARLWVNRLPPSLGCVEQRATIETVIVLVVSLAEQTWCLLGTEATAGFRSALAAVVPGLEEFLTF